MVVNEQIGSYRVARLMGEGGTGRVYECVHGVTGASAAVKVPRGPSALEREALRRESAALSRLNALNHPGLVRLLDRGVTENGAPWYAMEYIDGRELRAYIEELWDAPRTGPLLATATTTVSSDVAQIRKGPPLPARGPRVEARVEIDLSVLLALGARIAEALGTIHSEGIVHGDLTPRNILLRSSSEPVLIDFGAAFRVFQTDRAREVAEPPLLRGTPGYMAPELLGGGVLDARADCYALGCILYELVTGRKAFGGATRGDIQHLRASPTPEPASHHRRDVPAALDELILQLLNNEPSARWGRAIDAARRLWQLAGVNAGPPSLSCTSHTLLFRPPLIERDAALEALLHHARECTEGRGALAFVAGESGAGKTRLVNELAARAAALRLRVVSSRCAAPLDGFAGPSGGKNLEPLEPLLAAVADACAEGGGSLLEDLREPLGALQPYARDVLGVLSLPDQAEALSPELARARVTRSALDVLCRFASERPLLLIIDDLQWADELTVRVLADCRRAIESSRVLVVGTYRYGDGATVLPFKSGHSTELHLERLSLAAMRALAREMLGVGYLPEGLAEFLFRHSDGNPFFAAEYLRAALAQNCLRSDAAGRWHFHDDPTLAIPKTLDELFRLRLSGLSANALDALELASVLGREFELDLFQSLIGPGELTDGAPLEELIAREVLEWVPPGRYRFVHDKLREAQERALSSERRRELHSLAARWLEDAEEPNGSGQLSERIGVHWARAGEAQRALPHLDRAARLAQSTHAPARAAALYHLAIEQCRQCEGLAVELGPHRGALLEALGDALILTARHEEGRAAYLEAAEHERKAPLTVARIQRKHAASCWTLHEYDKADESFERAQSALGVPAPGDHAANEEYVALQIGRFEQLYFARRVDDSTLRAFRALKPLVDRSAPAAQKSHYYVGCAGLAYAGGRYAFSAEAVEFARLAVALNDASIPLNQLAEAKLSLGFALLAGTLQERREALHWMHTSEREAQRAGDATLVARALVYTALLYVRLDEVEQTRKLAERAGAAAHASQLSPYVAAAQASEAWAHWRSDEWAKARPLAERARATWRSHPHPYPFQWVALVPLFDMFVAEERFAEAGSLLAELLHPNQQALPGELTRLAEVVRAACGAGEAREVHRLSTMLLDSFRSFCSG